MINYKIVNNGDKFTIEEYPGIIFMLIFDQNYCQKLLIIDSNNKQQIGQIVNIDDNSGKIYVKEIF